MAENRKCFTFIWKIKNFCFCFNKQYIQSPLFFVHAISGTSWQLLLCPNSSRFRDCVACYIQRQSCDSAPNQLEVNYELSFLTGDGSVLRSQTFLKKICKKRHMDGEASLFAKRDEVFLLKKDVFIPDDTLTIRCRMWNSKESISEMGKCLAETRMETACIYFAGNIEKFFCLEPRKKHPVCIKSRSSEFFLFSMNLFVAADGKLDIEVKPLCRKLRIFYKCKIFILDKFGNKVKSGEGEFYDTEPHSIPLTLSKEYLIKTWEYFLPNEELTIHFEIIVDESKHTDKIEYILGFVDTQGLISNTRSSEEQQIGNLITLKDDLISLFREGILCDTKLKTNTETFPAHIVVLSARSPVFKSMFTTDMKEKTNNCVDIDDLDADTVRRMLLFMYSANLDDLEYESAKSLYFAADKYNIVSLIQRCSNFLKQNLLKSNCCDILLLADNHQDKDLKNAVEDYIAKNDEVVLRSEEWKNLEENYPRLTTEVLRAVYMKNRRN